MTLNIGYERKLGERFVPNGLCRNSPLYGRFVRAEGEYHEPYCRSPLLSLFAEYQQAFTENLIGDLTAKGQRYVYLIEMLYSMSVWVPQGQERESRLSPWNEIQPSTIEDLKSNRAVLLITHFKKPQDDPFEFHLFSQLHRKMESLGIPPQQVVFIGCNPELEDLYRHTLATDSEVKAPFRWVATIPYFEWGWNTYYRSFLKNDQIYQLHEAKEEKPKAKPKRYLCFNREPRAHRLIHLLWLAARGLLERGLVSFPKQDDYFKFDVSGTGKSSIQRVFTDPEILGLVSELDHVNATRLPLLVDHPDLFRLHIAWCTKAPFRDSYFSILTERLYQNANGHRLLTSKAFKSICNMHPFIILGPYGSLNELQKMGYRTFSPWIDESYDEIVDPNLRIQAVWREIERLCNLNATDIHAWYLAVFPTLEFNIQHFHQRLKDNPVQDFAKRLQQAIGEVSKPSHDLRSI